MSVPADDPVHAEAARALVPLDLTTDDLLQPVRVGAAARRTVTAHHPTAYAGWRDYGERVAALRDRLVPRGWRPIDRVGVCLVVHPSQKFAIMTAVGTETTGTDDPVKTVRPRGPVTQRIVKANRDQLPLDLGLPDQADEITPGAIPTWVLLVHPHGDDIQSELSLATHFDEHGYVDEFAARIPLPVVRLNEIGHIGPTDEEPPSTDFDVPEL